MLIRNLYRPYMQPDTKRTLVVMRDNRRLAIVAGCVGMLSVVLLVYGVGMQLAMGKMFTDRRENLTERSINEPALRGMITDRNGEILAVSRHFKTAEFAPYYIYKPKNDGTVNWNVISDEKFAQIAAILGLPEREVRAKLKDTSIKQLTFPVQLSVEKAKELKKLNIPTLKLHTHSERTYPSGSLFSHLIGFMGNEGQGLEGLELAQEEKLRGTDGKQIVLRDLNEDVIALVDSPKNISAQNGENLVLSLDREIQRFTRKHLADALARSNAKAGAAVVLNAQTGEVLAMSSLPDYDSNARNDFPEQNRFHFAVRAAIEPGSVIKPLVMAKAIDDGKVNRHTVFDTRPYQIGDKTIKDDHEYPFLDSEGIIEKSSNVGISKIAAMYDNQDLYNYFSAIGIGRKTQSGVSGEKSGELHDAQGWSNLDKAAMSYGYGLSMNLLQIAQAYTILTTDGKLKPITVFRQAKPSEGKTILRPETARQMREMMVRVTQSGTGRSGAITGYDVAAKTGTARKSKGKEGYIENGYYSSFVGFAPAKNPHLIVAVVIDEPKNNYYGGSVAGPAFKGIMADGLKYLNVKPTYLNHDAIAAR